MLNNIEQSETKVTKYTRQFPENLNIHHKTQPFHYRYLSKRIKSVCLHKDFCINVQNSFICNSHKLERTQYPSTDIYPYKRTLLSNKIS